MPEVSLTAFDVATAVIIGLSALVAYSRGAIREILTIGTWLGAGVVAFYGFPYARALARQTMETEWLADAVALCVVFLVPLIALKVAAAVLTERLPGGPVESVDRMVGVAFGIARGVIVICAAYLGFTILVAPEDQPDWIKNAALLPYVKDGAALLSRLMPDEMTPRGVEAVVPAPPDADALRALIDALRTSAQR